jgi:hypothetical protein
VVRRKNYDDDLVMIEVICTQPLPYSRRGKAILEGNPKDFTPGELYIASPVGSVYHLENNADQTRKISKDEFFNYFRSAM